MEDRLAIIAVDGMDAAYDGRLAESCPYPEGSRERAAWMDGFEVVGKEHD